MESETNEFSHENSNIDFYVFTFFNLFDLIKVLNTLFSIYDQKH